MAQRRRFRASNGSSRSVWTYVGLAAFVLVDVALVSWALNSADASTGSVASASSPPSSAPLPDPSPTPSVEAIPTTTPAPTRVLAALDATTAWRATTGSCPETPATPELTTDGGASWTATDAGVAGITAVQRLDVQSADIASVLGLTEEGCAPRVVRTFVAGADYSIDAASLASTWYLDTSAAASINTPNGSVAAPCGLPVVLAPRSSTEAAVLCGDQTLWSTVDSGDQWTSQSLPGILNVTETDSGYISVAIGASGCAGVQVTELSGSLAPGFSGCLPVDQSQSSLAGSVAVAHASGTTWVWVLDRVWRSGDEGVTWQ